jgi:predicted GNAT family acetyltransferase
MTDCLLAAKKEYEENPEKFDFSTTYVSESKGKLGVDIKLWR